MRRASRGDLRIQVGRCRLGEGRFSKPHDLDAPQSLRDQTLDLVAKDVASRLGDVDQTQLTRQRPRPDREASADRVTLVGRVEDDRGGVHSASLYCGYHERLSRGVDRHGTPGGGANWSGAAVDPETGVLYVPSTNAYAVKQYRIPDPDEGATLRYIELRGGNAPRPELPQGLPLFKPPYSRLTAIDMNTGEHV